jgi:GntR family transcriptional regulator, transcriptional repressor for pyruvate dehydrogenase complex
MNLDPVSVRPARTAELVAGELRGRILRGQLRNGERLPKEDELREMFGVSKASMREALLILETEGLITVRRGSGGGAVVRLPTPENAAWTLGVVLNAQNVNIDEVGEALRMLEPQCAVLCAKRPDRHERVVPVLRALQQQMEAGLDDGVTAVVVSRHFHEAIVENCGNRALTLVTGALERLWSAHERAWAERTTREGCFPDISKRRDSLDDHADVLALIEAGDERAGDALRRHLEHSQRYPSPVDDSKPVDLTSLRPRP